MKACIDNSCAGLAGAFGPSLRQPAGGRGAQVDRIGRRRAGKLWKLLCEAEGTAPVAPQSRRCTVTRELAALAQSPFQGAARGTRPRASSPWRHWRTSTDNPQLTAPTQPAGLAVARPEPTEAVDGR